MSIQTDVVVIGAGPGGYVAAIRAAQLGKRVTIVEREYIGGVCLNVGCIPSKALITVGHKYHDVSNFEHFGLEVSGVKADFQKVQAYKDGVVNQMTSGVEFLLQGNQVNIIRGEATFMDANNLSIDLAEGGEETLHFEYAIIATGSRPKEIPPLPFGERILDSTAALDLEEIPESMIVVGGGVIGIELASVYANFGTKVTIIEGMKSILPTISPRISKEVQKGLLIKGAEVYTSAMVQSSEERDGEVYISAEINGEVKEFSAQYALVSIGRTPNSDNLDLEAAGVEIDERGLIEKDLQNRTSASHIYAIGDVTEGAQLAHKASYEAKVAAEAIVGKNTINDYYAMPSVIFSDPEIAVVGQSEAELKEAGRNFIAKRFSFGANGRAVALNETNGFINLIVDKETNLILGAEIFGPEASNLINEITLAIESNLTVEDIALTIHPHPTLGEVVMEVAEYVEGAPIHTL